MINKSRHEMCIDVWQSKKRKENDKEKKENELHN